MRWTIDDTSDDPPFVQIRSHLEAAIEGGTLAVGSRIPSVREMAKTVGVAPGTVARAYRELEQRGLVDTRGRHGTYVSDPVDRRVRHRRELTEQAAAYARNARAFGIRPEVAIDLVEQALREGAIRSES